jgi:AraC family transcriptional regulator
MERSARAPGPIVADRPFFAEPERLDEIQSISSVSFARGDLSVAQYRRDRPGLGVTDANPILPMFMAVVTLQPLPGHGGWRDGRPVDVPGLGTGALSCLDLRTPWVSDLPHPFHTFHAFIPVNAFDEFNAELKQPKIERLLCPNTVETIDETMLGLAQALGPLMAKPGEASALFTDHVFSAMVAHLAMTYGGLKGSDRQAYGERRYGALTPFQERRVTSLLLDDLRSNPGLSELARFCGLSRSHFVRAFKQSTGLPPHRWLLMQRINRAKELLYQTRTPIGEIAAACGFADQGHLTRVFTKAFGIGPGGWRRHRQG